MSHTTGQTLLAVATGAAIGAGIGILYAPDKGEQTRKKIQKQAQKTQKEIERQLHLIPSKISGNASKARKKFESKLEDTLSVMGNEADEILLALEEKLEELKAENAKLQKKNANTMKNKSAGATK